MWESCLLLAFPIDTPINSLHGNCTLLHSYKGHRSTEIWEDTYSHWFLAHSSKDNQCWSNTSCWIHRTSHINLVCSTLLCLLPEEAPTLLEFIRDLTTAVIIGDFLMFLNHIMHHKVKYLYKNVHYIHHQVKSDMFSWSTGWVHPLESITNAFLMLLYAYIRP